MHGVGLLPHPRVQLSPCQRHTAIRTGFAAGLRRPIFLASARARKNVDSEMPTNMPNAVAQQPNQTHDCKAVAKAAGGPVEVPLQLSAQVIARRAHCAASQCAPPAPAAAPPFFMQSCSQPHLNLKAASSLGVHSQFLGPLGLTTLSSHKVRRPPGLSGPPWSSDSSSDSFSDSSSTMAAAPAAKVLGACAQHAERPVLDRSAQLKLRPRQTAPSSAAPLPSL
mmetsp:Transcript_37889/g.121925  ORF Transcript_37889/g.121925 Transcript_37889/m.121925 type:complete len:223 (+) Transcript_37889:122-790(+)|eukprot:scaffold11464_cov174-Isochrysis_galbana.AAC.1